MLIYDFLQNKQTFILLMWNFSLFFHLIVHPAEYKNQVLLESTEVFKN